MFKKIRVRQFDYTKKNSYIENIVQDMLSFSIVVVGPGPSLAEMDGRVCTTNFTSA